MEAQQTPTHPLQAQLQQWTAAADLAKAELRRLRTRTEELLPTVVWMSNRLAVIIEDLAYLQDDVVRVTQMQIRLNATAVDAEGVGDTQRVWLQAPCGCDTERPVRLWH